MFLINGYEGLLGTAFLSPPPPPQKKKKKILQTIIVGDFNDFFLWHYLAFLWCVMEGIRISADLCNFGGLLYIFLFLHQGS